MASNRFSESGRKLEKKKIALLEEQLGYELPDDYRRFLLTLNGGRPEKAFFTCKGNPFPSSVDWLCRVDKNLARPEEKAHYFTLAAALANEGKVVPKDMLVIGRVDQDDPLMLSIRGRRKGKVFVKRLGDMEPAPIEQRAKRPEEKVYQVAKSFADFLESLVHSEEE